VQSRLYLAYASGAGSIARRCTLVGLPDISVAQIPIALKLKADNIVRRHYLLIGTAGSGLVAGLPLILNSTNTW